MYNKQTIEMVSSSVSVVCLHVYICVLNAVVDTISSNSVYLHLLTPAVFCIHLSFPPPGPPNLPVYIIVSVFHYLVYSSFISIHRYSQSSSKFWFALSTQIVFLLKQDLYQF